MNSQIEDHDSVNCRNGRDLAILSQKAESCSPQAMLASCNALGELACPIMSQCRLGVSKALEMRCAIIAWCLPRQRQKAVGQNI